MAKRPAKTYSVRLELTDKTAERLDEIAACLTEAQGYSVSRKDALMRVIALGLYHEGV
jgi:hypothetical protein